MIAIVYATWHGHVRAIAEQLAATATLRGVECTPHELAAAQHRDVTDHCDAVVIAGSVHFGRHARVLRRFVERKLALLSRVPSAFLSVSAAAASLEGRVTADGYITDFIRVTGWQPDLTLSVPGAVLYTTSGHLAAQLPPDLGRHLLRAEAFEHLSLDRYYGRIAHRQSSDLQHATLRPRVVMGTIAEARCVRGAYRHAHRKDDTPLTLGARAAGEPHSP